MQSKLYRFEILRSLANGVYEAKDPANGSITFLYEWTPLPADRVPAKQRLEQIGEQLTCEVFTSDASLYVATASRELGRDAINALRSHGLFTGTWLDDPPPPIPPPVPPSLPPPVAPPWPTPVTPPRPVPPPAKPVRRRWGWIIVSMLAIGGIAYLIGDYQGYTRGYRLGAISEDDSLNPQIRQLQADNGRLQSEVSNQSSSSRSSSDALKSFGGTQILRAKDGCSLPIRLAVLYTDYNGDRLVKGWTRIEPGESAIVAASPSADFSVYAETMDSQMSWVNTSAPPIAVAQNDFAYNQQDTSAANGLRSVYPLLVHIAGYGDTTTFDCHGK